MTFFGSQFFVGTSKPRSMKRCRPIPMTCCMADIAADFFICFSRRGVFRLCMASQFRNAKTNGVFYTTKGPNHHSKGQALPTALFRRYYNFSVSPFYFQPFLGAKKWWFQRCWILFTLKPGSFWSNLTKKPWKLTWQWKIHHERRCGEIYHCYVSLPEGNIFPMGDSITSSFFFVLPWWRSDMFFLPAHEGFSFRYVLNWEDMTGPPNTLKRPSVEGCILMMYDGKDHCFSWAFLVSFQEE